MDPQTLITTIGITAGVALPICLLMYILYRVCLYFGLMENERDLRFKMFTLATLSTLVAGEKTIPYFGPETFSQELFVVSLTMPITMFYFNHFFRESSLKKKTLERFHIEMLLSSLACCIAVAFMMSQMK
jgi:hypothetical protein